jgi:hypothetical protein
MEALALVIAWPLLVFFIGFLVIAVLGASTFDALNVFALPLIIVIALFLFARSRNKAPGTSSLMQSRQMQSFVVSLSIGLLVPLFIYELLKSADRNLFAMIIALIVGFGFMVWGMFIKDNAALRRANLIGGALTVVYAYTQIWSLGDAARVVAAAIGLVVAVTIGVIKFKDKLK